MIPAETSCWKVEWGLLVLTYLVESFNIPHLVESGSVVLIVEPHVLQLEGGDGGVDEQTHLEVLTQLQLF